MPAYKAPVRDIRFLMNEVFDYPAHYKTLNLKQYENLEFKVFFRCDFSIHSLYKGSGFIVSRLKSRFNTRKFVSKSLIKKHNKYY